jgi:hypothetical protein
VVKPRSSSVKALQDKEEAIIKQYLAQARLRGGEGRGQWRRRRWQRSVGGHCLAGSDLPTQSERRIAARLETN